MKELFHGSVKDVKALLNVDIESDHTLLKADIITKLKRIKKTGIRKPRWDLK